MSERILTVPELAALCDIEKDLAEISTMQDAAGPRQLDRWYRVLHYITAPHCRKNHEDWEPKPSPESLTYAARDPEEMAAEHKRLAASLRQPAPPGAKTE